MSNIIQFPTNPGSKSVEENPENTIGNPDPIAYEPDEEYHQFRQLLVSEIVQLRKDVGEV